MMSEGDSKDRGERSDRGDKNERSGRNDKRETDAAGRTSAGGMLREARLAAGLDAVRLASDLRISSQALEALETSQYHLLPGDPYVRALLSSLARQLHLDPQKVVQTYIQEMGLAPVQGQVAPYQDKGESLTSSHRQILIGLMVLLLVGFVLVLRQLNRPNAQEPEASPAAGPVLATDTLAALAADSLPVSRSLAPDTSRDSIASVEGRRDSSSQGTPPKAVTPVPPAPAAVTPAAPVPATVPVPKAPETKPAEVKPAETKTLVPAKPDSAKFAAAPSKKDSVKPAVTAKTDSVKPAPVPVASEKDPKPQRLGSGSHVALFHALGDSLWVKVMHEDKAPDIRLLMKGKSLQINHGDTLRIALSKKGILELTLDGKVMQPTRKRFKVYGTFYKSY